MIKAVTIFGIYSNKWMQILFFSRFLKAQSLTNSLFLSFLSSQHIQLSHYPETQKLCPKIKIIHDPHKVKSLYNLLQGSSPQLLAVSVQRKKSTDQRMKGRRRWIGMTQKERIKVIQLQLYFVPRKVKYLRCKKNQKRELREIGGGFEGMACGGLNILSIKISYYLNYYIYQSETKTISSMQLNTVQLESDPSSTFIRPSMSQKPSFINLPFAFGEKSLGLNQHLGDLPYPSEIQDSNLTKYTKCTFAPSSNNFDENEDDQGVWEYRPRIHRKELKKEMKNQKIKRKVIDENQLNNKKIKNFILNRSTSNLKSLLLTEKNTQKKNAQNYFRCSPLDRDIQKLTSDNFANSKPKKKIHSESSSATSHILKCFEPILIESTNKKSASLIQNTLSEKNTKNPDFFTGEESIESEFSNEVQCDYFLQDLIGQFEVKSNKKTDKRVNTPKMAFVQTMLNLSESYQIPIEQAKVGNSEIKLIPLERRSQDQGKKTLLIDLDDTLIFTEKPISSAKLSEGNQDSHIIYQGDNKKCRILHIRPHARELIARMSEHYEIIIFTAATANYAQQIKSVLDPHEKFIAHLLSREHCFNPNLVQENQGKLPYVKDLRRIDRDLSQTVLLDNSIYCFWYQIQNGIPITSYSKVDSSERELVKVESYLLNLLKERDVRIKNRQFFKLSRFQEFVDSMTLVKQLYMEQEG